MKRLAYYLLLLFVVLSLAACHGGRKADVAALQGDTLHLKYAQLVHIVKYDGFTTVTIDNPWHKGHVLHRYVLTKGQPNGKIPEGTVVHVPISRSVVFTTTHCYLFGLLGGKGTVVGACDVGYIQVPWVREGVANGRIVDCGNGMEPLIEKIIDLRPDVLFLSPFENSGGYGKIDELGIPYFECAEYMEGSALARAEWMKVYGLLIGKEAEADSLFDLVEREYKALADTARTSHVRRSIITEKLTGSTWYVPGGKSTVGQLIADAQGEYAFAADDHAGSLALPFETVLDKAGNADVWIFNYNDRARTYSYSMLQAEYRGYPSMKAFRDRKVWYVNTLTTPYFEEVSFRPDYLLRDYIILLHPDLQLGALRYYQPLSP